MAFQRPAIRLAQHRAAAGGQHERAVGAAQLGEGVLLDIAEGCLAMLLEIGADRPADAVLDLMVAVDEAPAELAGELPSDGGLAAAGHAD